MRSGVATSPSEAASTWNRRRWVRVEQNTISGNVANRGGGIAVIGATGLLSNTVIARNTILGNAAGMKSGGGGGIYSQGNRVHIADNLLALNAANPAAPSASWRRAGRRTRSS